MGSNRFCLVFLLISLSCVVDGASILALFSSLSYSDHLVFRGYVSLLAQSGHSLVVMTPYPGQFMYPDTENIVELDVGQESAPFWDEYKKLLTNTDDYYPQLRAMNELSLKIAIAQLKSKQMTALFINPNIKFDLVITEADVPLLYAVADKYKVPHISITTSNGKIHQYEAKGNPIHPILYPDVNTLNYGNLSRWQKVIEFYRHIQTKNEFYNNYLPLSELAAKKIFGLKRDLQQVEYDIDLLFIASNPLLIGNRPVVPAITFVDRMHITPDISLPQNVQAFLDSQIKGVVYFSVGAIQDAEQLSPRILQIFADAFKELPFTVLWKIGNTTMVNKSNNVVTQAWFPQQQILAHRNVKAFITHGGQRSLEEALFYEVPIIGLPFVKSRKTFIGEYIKYGVGEIVNPYDMDEETLKTIITAVASDNKYKKAIVKLKDMVVDDVISGPELAVWWTEYVLRNGGAQHLRSAAVGATFVKYYMLDLLSYLLAGVLFTIYLTFCIVRYIVSRLRKRYILERGIVSSVKFKAL
ncbi:UDP-glucosyltransferase 2-like [Manduca sexta]|uniref:UDP-glucuronosyltransferase n=1 Tax=Manduca sexta TaxID=7130 RepID=A0A922CL90_MANSE|nr:UDP-glucosyltransferase 2-like [Manduca sexta]KAG6449959.1 UDP-glycosyltransferase [Manduca sexta]